MPEALRLATVLLEIRKWPDGNADWLAIPVDLQKEWAGLLAASLAAKEA